MIRYEFRVELYFSTRCSGNGWTECVKEFDTKEQLLNWCERWNNAQYDEEVEIWLRDLEGGCPIMSYRQPQGFEIITTEEQIY